MLKKFAIFIVLLIVFLPTAYASYGGYSEMQEYLCQIGITYYKEGRYDDAIAMFKKALMIQPDYEPALKYIQMIEQLKTDLQTKESQRPLTMERGRQVSSTVPVYAQEIDDTLDILELQEEMIKERQKTGASTHLIQPSDMEISFGAPKKVTPDIKTVELDASSADLRNPIEIEKGASVIIIGKNIQKFLVIQTEILSVERLDQNRILVTGKNIGYDYVYIWDDYGRWETEWLGVFPKAEGESLEEELRQKEEYATAFKLRYNLDWYSFREGRRLDSSLKRKYYSWNHSLLLTGSTPYGDLDSLLKISTWRTFIQKAFSDVTYFTIGLQNGRVGSFEDFSLRGFDFYPSNLTNLIMGGGTNLRGVMFDSPAFQKKLKYTLFWGKEAGGSYGVLSPGLRKVKKSYLAGTDVNISPTEDSNYGFSVVHGYGSQRDTANLGAYAYDTYGNWQWGDWDYRYEVGYDAGRIAYLVGGNYMQDRIRFAYEFRDFAKNYINMVANTWKQGERGALFTLQLQPNSALRIDNRLDVFQDRQFPAAENQHRWNEDYDFNLRYDLNPATLLKADYSIQNELGRFMQRRYQNYGAGINRTFNLVRNINTYVYLSRQESNSTGFDYINNRVAAGLSFRLIGQLGYFLNTQWDWLEEKLTGNSSTPQLLETGLLLDGQILNTPFYESARLIFHDERHILSPFSFLSGEDYLEGYAEISYRPKPQTEYYGSVRVRNVWAENPDVTKRMEAEFNAGLRYLWDTGIHWNAVGDIAGYVFIDTNSDGLRQKDEVPVEGVKVWLGKDKFQITDIFGYYKFKRVRAKKAFVSLDVSTLPTGFVLTVPFNQQAVISQNHTVRVDFGIIARSEISGWVFEDVNGDNEYSASDNPVRGVTLVLENGKKAITDTSGRYIFANVSSGEHTLTLDLNTLPVSYLPKVPISTSIAISEGASYIHNIPLTTVKEE
ncbi:MAG: tetratricopeptide repeat protein [Candidatus Omnitrophica bacterium]|nr:tetratricopeptide repeat protein [Candidatus Omnitrophota bacterium]